MSRVKLAMQVRPLVYVFHFTLNQVFLTNKSNRQEMCYPLLSRKKEQGACFMFRLKRMYYCGVLDPVVETLSNTKWSRARGDHWQNAYPNRIKLTHHWYYLNSNFSSDHLLLMTATRCLKSIFQVLRRILFVVRAKNRAKKSILAKI